MDCKTCKDNRAVVSFAAFESAMLRAERANKRLWFIVLLLIVLLFGTNAAWLYYESSFEDIEVTQENEGGFNNFIGNDGDIYNGEADN